MKKIIIALCMVVGFATFSSAQVPTKTTQKTTVKKETTAKKEEYVMRATFGKKV